MKYSLITVTETRGNRIDGAWVQNHIGTIETAIQAARSTEAANHRGKPDIAVVAELSSVVPMGHWTDLIRLDA